MNKKTKRDIWLIIGVALLLLIISLLTKYSGRTDVSDYTDTAKFFAGDFQAKLRSAHSLVYGYIHYPIVKLTNSFIPFKITTILCLLLIILSVYYISNKNKKTLLLILTAPIIWYLAPWITPVPLAGLLLLWSYFFIKKFSDTDKLRYLFYSAILIGLASIVWDPILYFSVLLVVSFLYDKKPVHFLYFFIFYFIALIPRLILDQLVYNFAFYGIIRYFFALLAYSFYGGIYNNGLATTPLNLIILLLFIPVYSYLIFTKKSWQEDKKTLIFVSLSLLMILFNAQIRFALMVVPIIILYLGKNLNTKKFKILLVISLIIALLALNPYFLDMKYETNAGEFNYFVHNINNLQLNKTFRNDLITSDLSQIAKDYPNANFVVGNNPDDYAILANLYWGKEINEFISIQDYQLFMKNETIVSGRTLCTKSKPDTRRDMCLTISLTRNLKDTTDYNSIKYAISLQSGLNIDNFKLVKKYEKLSVFEKI